MVFSFDALPASEIASACRPAFITSRRPHAIHGSITTHHQHSSFHFPSRSVARRLLVAAPPQRPRPPRWDSVIGGTTSNCILRRPHSPVAAQRQPNPSSSGSTGASRYHQLTALRRCCPAVGPARRHPIIGPESRRLFLKARLPIASVRRLAPRAASIR